MWIVENIVKKSLDWNQYIQAQLSSLLILYIAIFSALSYAFSVLVFGTFMHIERKHKLNNPADVFTM